MYCSTCGASIPKHRSACETCGTPVRASLTRQEGAYQLQGGRVALTVVGTCPRCDYQGQGLPYFSRGPHMATLIGATLFTLPSFGAGGLIYYGVRRDHRVCPRCGKGWGKGGEKALAPHAEMRPAERGARESALANPGVSRTWSIILGILGGLMISIGVIEFEIMMVLFGTLAAVGAVVLHRTANRAREERRAALIARMQMPVLKLAAERSGRLTVTEVAAHLGWPLRRAEKVLQSLDDGWRVNSEVTDEGVIVYEFREIMLKPGEKAEPERLPEPDGGTDLSA